MPAPVCETGWVPPLPGDAEPEYRAARREATDAVMKLLLAVREDPHLYASDERPDFRHVAALLDVARYAREGQASLDRAHDAPANGRYWWEEEG